METKKQNDNGHLKSVLCFTNMKREAAQKQDSVKTE